MTRHTVAMILVVERTKFGWSVRADADQLGLFTTQRYAIEAAGRCQARLKAKGQFSTVSVVGVEAGPSARSSARSFWSR